MVHSISLGNAAKLIVENAKYSLTNHSDKIAIILFGAPGSGKTEIVKNQLRDDNDDPYPVEIIDMNTVNAGSLAMPIQDQDTKQVAYYMHPQIQAIAKKAQEDPTRPAFLALDEMNRADEQFTKPQLLNLLLNNKLADFTLPKNVFIVGMSNLAEQKVNGQILSNDVTEFDSATSNRMLQLFGQIDAKEWLEYAYQLDAYGHNNVSPEIALYIESGNEGSDSSQALLYEPSNTEDEDLQNNAFATPRSWKRLSAILENKIIRENPNLLKPAVYGQIGDKQGAKFLTWLKTHGTMVPVANILNEPESFKDLVHTNAEKIQFFMSAPNYIGAGSSYNEKLANNFVKLYMTHVAGENNNNIAFRWHNSFSNNRIYKLSEEFYTEMLNSKTTLWEQFMNHRTSILRAIS